MFGIPWASLPYAGSPAVSYPAAGASEKVLFMNGEASDAATIAAGASALMAAANLQNMQPAKKWRSSATSDYLTITLASPLAANAIMFNACNFSDAAVVRVRGYRTAADMAGQTNEVVDTNWSSVWPLNFKPRLTSWPRYMAGLRWSNAAALQYWRVDLVDGGGGTTYLEAGRLVLAAYWQPTANADIDGSIGFECADVQVRSPFGNIYTDARRTGRGFELKFSATEWRDAFDLFGEMQRRRGMAKDVICIIDPAATTDFQRFALHGVITSVGKLVPTPQWSGTTAGGQMLWSFTITLSELLD